MTASWDTNNNFVISWTETTAGAATTTTSTPATRSWQSTGVRARMYRLYDANGDFAPAIIRDEFRANSADRSAHPESATYWPIGSDGRPGGVGRRRRPGDHLRRVRPGRRGRRRCNLNQDLDSVLDDLLIEAYNSGATDEEIAQLREAVQPVDRADPRRGQRRDVLLLGHRSRAECADRHGQRRRPINAERDGHNTRYTIELDRRLTGGSFVVHIINAWDTEEDVTLTPVYDGDPAIINPGDTREALEEQLRAALVTGTNWPWDDFRGPVAVNLLSERCRLTRQGTPWEIPVDEPVELHLRGHVHRRNPRHVRVDEPGQQRHGDRRHRRPAE